MASFSRGLGCTVGLTTGLLRTPVVPFSHMLRVRVCGPAAAAATAASTLPFSTSAVCLKRPPKARAKPYPRPEFASGKYTVPSRIVMPDVKVARAKPAVAAATAAVAAAKTTASSTPATSTFATPAPRPASVSPTKTATPTSTPRVVPRSTYAEQLGLRAGPTLLYEAPSHAWYRVFAISLGFTFMAYSVLNYWDIYLNAPKDILWWVPYAFAGICAFMAAFGAYMFRGLHGIVRSIRAVPTARVEQLCGKRAAADVAAAVQRAGLTPATAPPVVLELKIGRMIPVPLLPPRTRYALPGTLTLPARLAGAGLTESATGAFGATRPADPTTSSLKDRVLTRRAEEERKRAAREYEMSHLMTAPFRHMGQGASTAWKQIARAFSHEGFMRVTEQATGKRHKLDVTGGWALDNGRALDRLVTVFDDE